MSLRNSCSESVVMSGRRSIAGLLAARLLVDRALLLRGRERGIDLLDELDLGLLEEAVQLLDVGLVHVELGDGGRDLGERQHADLLPLEQQALDLFELLQFND